MRKILYFLATVLLAVGLYFEVSSRIKGVHLAIPESQEALLILNCAGAPCPGKPLKENRDLPTNYRHLYENIVETPRGTPSLHFIFLDRRSLKDLGNVLFCVENNFSSTDQMYGWVQLENGEMVWLSFPSTSWAMVKLGLVRHSTSENSFVPCGISSRFSLFKFANATGVVQ